MESSFFAMLSRMKYIDRWGLMRNTRTENLSEHSLEVGVIAHALAVIGNVRLNKNYNAERVALGGIYHDASEIITGDLPTPIKYYNPEIKTAYKQIEHEACIRLTSLLPEDMREEYNKILESDDENIERLVKAADKISALIKCVNERKAGNSEFVNAEESTIVKIHELGCDEAEIFLAEFMPSFELTLDRQSGLE